MSLENTPGSGKDILIDLSTNQGILGSPKLAASFYNTPTAAAAAAAIASRTVTPTVSRPASNTPARTLSRATSRSLSRVTDSMYADRELSQQGGGSRPMPADVDSEDSELLLVDTDRVEGAVVAIENYTGGRFSPAVEQKDTFWPCTFNLSKVIMGAGMMAIPKAFNLLGLLPGIAIMLLMAFLTFFTLASLISATAATKAGSSYGMLVRKTVGGAADNALQLAVLANCFVMNIVFVVVLGDLLLGTAPEYAGLLPELLNSIGYTPDPTTCWLVGRPFVLGMLSLLVLLPLSSMRSMEKLAVVNIIGVSSNGLFAGLMLALAASAAANGQLKPPQLLPDLSQLGSTPVFVVMSLASIVPVLLNCDVCHQSLHPLMPLLKPYTVGRMQRLVATALGICNVLYFTVTLCSGLVFGEALDADVLANVNAGAMGPLIGPAVAGIMAGLVRVGYLCSIVGSYVLLCYPLRQCICDMLLPGGQQAIQQHWQVMTVLLVGSVYAIACYLPSIWGALALIGATASTVQAFIIPGLVVLAVDRAAEKAAAVGACSTPLQPARPEDSTRMPLLPARTSAAAAKAPFSATKLLRQATAAFVIMLGVLLFMNGVVDSLWDTFHPSMDGQASSRNNVGLALMDTYRYLLRPLL